MTDLFIIPDTPYIGLAVKRALLAAGMVPTWGERYRHAKEVWHRQHPGREWPYAQLGADVAALEAARVAPPARASGPLGNPTKKPSTFSVDNRKATN